MSKNNTGVALISESTGLSLLIILGLGMCGCTSNPDFIKPNVLFAPAYLHADKSLNFEPNGDQRWWQQFGDKQLALLVERAAVANHDIRIAVERARQARAGTEAVVSSGADRRGSGAAGI